MDSQINIYNKAFFQSGSKFEIPVFKGTFRYQYGVTFGDVLHTIWRFVHSVTIKDAQTLLRAESEIIKEGATVTHVINSTVQFTVGSVLGATVDMLAFKLIEMREKQNAAPLSNPPIVVSEMVQAGSGRKRRRAPF